MYMMKLISNAYDTPLEIVVRGSQIKMLITLIVKRHKMKLEFNFLIQVKAAHTPLHEFKKKPLTNAKQVSGNLNLIMSIS